MSMKSPRTRRERPRQIEASTEPIPDADCSWATDGLLLGVVSPAAFSPPRRRFSPSSRSSSDMPLVNFQQPAAGPTGSTVDRRGAEERPTEGALVEGGRGC